MKETEFSHYRFQPFIYEALNELGFTKPTEIQEKLIPAILNGESAIGQSQTGTGKTHSYLLPIIHKIDPAIEQVQVVISSPTRELAQQIHHELLKILKHSPEEAKVTAKLFIGGTDRLRTIEKLKRQPHIVVGTPGRIKDLMKEQALKTYTATTLVIDEADLTLDLGFLEDVDQVAATMPEDLQMLVFSATIPERLKQFLKKYMENPKHVQIAPKQQAAKNITHHLVPLRHRHKMQLLYDIAVTLNPYMAMIFANTKNAVDEVASYLTTKGLHVGVLHGGLTPRERKKMLKSLKEAEYQYVVATDLAARGIDIEGVSHVINVEFPKDLDFYIHRVGRTARAGYSGNAFTIYEQSDEDSIARLEKRNIQFTHIDLKDGEWIDLGEREKRKKRKPQKDEIGKQAERFIQKPKQVKPGYKKKRQQQIEAYKKNQKRKQNRKGQR